MRLSTIKTVIFLIAGKLDSHAINAHARLPSPGGWTPPPPPQPPKPGGLTQEMRLKDPAWLEVALNGPWSRSRQPNIPVHADEIIEAALACAGEGASIFHFHAYDPDSGRQRDDYEIYAPIIERIRSRADVICHGTLPFAGSVDSPSPLTPAQRYGAVDQLVRARLIEWSVVDPGSTTISRYADIAAGKEGFVYANPESHIRHGLSLAQQHRITPSYAIYEPGFMRLGAACTAPTRARRCRSTA